MEYTVVSRKVVTNAYEVGPLGSFIVDVNSKMRDGWRCVGGISTSVATPDSTNSGTNVSYFVMQAMIRGGDDRSESEGYEGVSSSRGGGRGGRGGGGRGGNNQYEGGGHHQQHGSSSFGDGRGGRGGRGGQQSTFVSSSRGGRIGVFSSQRDSSGDDGPFDNQESYSN